MTIQLLESWLKKEQEKILEKYRVLNKVGLKKPQIIFAGDSIVEYFPIEELFTSEKTIVNRGIRGYTSKQLLVNQEIHFFGDQLEEIYLLIGTNDLGKEIPLEETLANLEQLFYNLQFRYPMVEIRLLSILPVYESEETRGTLYSRTNQAIEEMNQAYQQLADRFPLVSFVDVSLGLQDQTGQLKKAWTTDGLHLTVPGYIQLTANLTATFLK